MDDCYDENYNNGLVDSSSYIICANIAERYNAKKPAIQFSSHPLGKKTKAKKIQEVCVQVSRPTSVLKKTCPIVKNQATDARCLSPEKSSTEPYCNVKMDSIIKLKDSTRKLLRLLEEIQSKTNSKHAPPPLDPYDTVSVAKCDVIPSDNATRLVADVLASPALNQLETQTKTLQAIDIEEGDDDCSIFKRLTRKCNCLNQLEYNDFIIHFNEDTKYYTSTIGEIIKNLRILKKFLYIGGTYTKNALIFLNEGLSDSEFSEKVEITQGCSHSDMCNVFEEQSIVATCIIWPSKFDFNGDSEIQSLAATFLHKLAQIEEGRRYLKFTSKITNDIKKALRRKGSKLDIAVIESLNDTINLMHPQMTQHVNVTYYCRPIDEGYGIETMRALLQYREYMTLDEIFLHLDLLYNLSNEDKGKTDLTAQLPALLLLFKQMLKEYDNSEMNIIITNILNNIVSKSMLKPKFPNLPKTVTIADVATEPIKMKNQMIQIPPKKHTHKKLNNRKGYSVSSNKGRQTARHKERSNIIVVPIEKSKLV